MWLYRLISASVGTVVYYGFQCQTTTRDAFLLLCLAIGIAGSILPFTTWFNMRDYKVCRLMGKTSAFRVLIRCFMLELAHSVLPHACVQWHRSFGRALTTTLLEGDGRIHIAHCPFTGVVHHRTCVLRNAFPRMCSGITLAIDTLVGLPGRRFPCHMACLHRVGDQPAQARYGGDAEWD